MRREADILVVVTCSLALAIIIVAFPFASPVRVVLGLPFVFLFPGYSLIAALFPRKDDLDAIERIALSLGLSIAVVPLIGLALNYSPWGISLNPTLAFITLFIVLTATAGLIRRRMLPARDAFSLTIDFLLPRWSQARLAGRLSAVGMVLAVVALGVAVYFVTTSRDSSETFTEFYVLGPRGKAEGYPSRLRVGESSTVILGIVNREGQETAHRVAVRIDGETTDSIDDLLLADGGRWQGSVRLTPIHAGDDQKVEFLLYRDGKAVPFRRLHLWLTVEPAVVEMIPPPTLDSEAGPLALTEAVPPSDEEAPQPQPTPPPGATPTPQPTPPPPEPPTLHTVVSGENLTRIARDYGLTLEALLTLNDIENPNLIYPNQRIDLPPTGGEREGQ